MKNLFAYLLGMLRKWGVLSAPTWKLSIKKGYGEFLKGPEQFSCMFTSKRVGRSVLDIMSKQVMITADERAALVHKLNRSKLPEEAPNDFRSAAFSAVLLGRPSFAKIRAMCPLQ